MGGRAVIWKNWENETIGLTHPFRHDLTSRGSSIASYDGVGTGNDFAHWEWYKDTHVAFGSVIIDDDNIYKYPAPDKMYWRPDKMIVEYNISGVAIHEEKFISDNDVISTIITSSMPVKIQIDGKNFVPDKKGNRNVVSTARCLWDSKSNAVHVKEGGSLDAKVFDNPETWKNGKNIYDGLTTVLSTSKPL